MLVGPRILPLNGSVQVLYDRSGEADPVLMAISLVLAGLSCFFAILAFIGSSFSRGATLVLITLNFVWWNYIAFLFFFSFEDKGWFIGFAGQVLIPPIWLGFAWWNYTRPDIGNYYRQQEALEKA